MAMGGGSLPGPGLNQSATEMTFLELYQLFIILVYIPEF